MSDKGRARRETRRKKEYGRFTVVSERTGRNTEWMVQRESPGRSYSRQQYATGIGKDGKKRAKALAAALDAANVLDIQDVMPPSEPTEYGCESEWEEWTAESTAIPAEMFKDGKYSAAGYLHAVYRLRNSQIARKLGVSEQSVSQYLSDLRAGRRESE